MIQSMTGFGSKEAEVWPFGKICVEMRSSNHKFLETVCHLPAGFLSLEDKIKKEIESEIKRGRLTCVVSAMAAEAGSVFVNKTLLETYVSTLKNIKKQFQIQDEISINTLIHLPGILSLREKRINAARIWPRLRLLVNAALADLVKMRRKEGRALFVVFKKSHEALSNNLGMIKARFKKALKEKLKEIETDEERTSFLKETDITEEVERLAFHIRNFKNKLSRNGPVGKELDFIAQEMQREANTLAAKSFGVAISARVVQMKSQIEKIREQVQNIE